MQLQFVRIERKNGTETKKVLFTWHDIPEEDISSVCQNFIDGFLYAMDSHSQLSLTRPSVMVMDGWWCQTRAYEDGYGFQWRFEDENGKCIRRWNKRKV